MEQENGQHLMSGGCKYKLHKRYDVAEQRKWVRSQRCFFLAGAISPIDIL